MAKKQAIEGKRANTFLVDPNDLVIVGVDTEHKTNKEHSLYDQRVEKFPVDERLVNSMITVGWFGTILVKKEGDDTIVVAGRRRVRAAREANKRLAAEGKETFLVECKVRRGTEASLYGVMIAENELREGDDLLTKAEKAQRLLDMGKDEEEVAIVFGVTTQAVKNWVSLLDCCAEVREQVSAGTISASVACKLSALKPEDQVKEMQTMIAEGKATTAEATARVRARRNGGDSSEASAAPGKRKINKLLAYHRSLEESPLSEDFVRALRWAMGDLNTNSIKGLAAMLNEAGA